MLGIIRAILIALVLSLTAHVRAQQVVQTFSVQDFFGVSHPDQILEFSLSNSVNPSLSYVIGPGGTEVPYQLLRDNKLAIRSDLPANAQRSWQLISGRAPASSSGGVQVTQTSDYYEVVNGLTGVRIVKPTAPGALNLAPIQGIRLRDARWTATGPNRLYQVSGAQHSNALITTAKSMTVTVQESGPLKVVIQVSNAYDRPLWQYGSLVIPAGPGFYVSTIELQAGQPSILIEDDTDMEFRYSLNVYAAVQPNQGRYRSHHSDKPAWGYEPSGAQYRQEHQRPPMDAYRDFTYSQPVYDSYTTGDYTGYQLLQRMTAWDKWAFNTGRQYWMLYNKDAAASSPLVGIFPAKASRAIGVHASGPGPYFLPNDGTGQRAAGFSFQAIHRGANNLLHPRHRLSWGIFVGDKITDLGDPYQVQNVGRQHNLHGGFSLNKIKDYHLTFSDPPQGYGRMFMEPEILQQIITRLRSGDSTYYNYLRAAEPYSQPLLDLWRDGTGAKTRAAASEILVLARTMLNAFVNGDGIHDNAYGYWQGALAMTGKALVIDSILADPVANATDKVNMKAVAALFGNMLYDSDSVPVDATDSRVNLGTANMPIQWAGARNLFAFFIASHPTMQARLSTIGNDVLSVFRGIVNDAGASIGSPHYTGASITPSLNALLQARMAGVSDPFAVEPRIARFAEFYMNLLTPPEVRFGTARKIISASDGSTESDNNFLFGAMATGFRTANPALSSRLMGAWNQAGKTHSGFFASTILMINESAPSIDPVMGNAKHEGYLSILRNGWGTPRETALWLFGGDWYRDHRHYTSVGYTDHGAIVLYALGAPLSINWGSFYTPQTMGGAMKSVIIPESGFSSWNTGHDLITGQGWRSSTNDLFASFSLSAAANARMSNHAALLWTRATMSLHPNDSMPIIFITDNFGGVNPTQPKICIFNMMAQGGVATPSGTLTPQVITGGNPIAGPGFSLAAGLNRLGFTGQIWNAHPTGGIDWDVYTLSSESVSGNIGNWGHTWHPSREQGEFYRANGRAFEEHQHILRLRGTGSFRTLILPFRKGQKPGDLQVRQAGANIEVTTAGQITTINDNWYAYTNANKRVLTTFTSAGAAAFGLSASGGPTEVVLETSRATITAHGARGPRRVQIPASWKPVVPLVVPTQQFGEWVINYDSNDPVTIVLE